MHNQRAMALLGATVGVIGLFVKAVSSDAEGLMPGLAQAVPDFPDGLPTIRRSGHLGAGRPRCLDCRRRGDCTATAAEGPTGPQLGHCAHGHRCRVVYAIVKWLDASDAASNLTDSFAQLARPEWCRPPSPQCDPSGLCCCWRERWWWPRQGSRQ